MPIKALLFDKDGTLLDFEATFAPATALVLNDLAQGDQKLAERLAESVGFDMSSLSIAPGAVLVAGSLENISECLMKPMGATNLESFNARVDALYIKHSLTSLAPFDYLIPTLDRLEKLGLPMGVATNDSEEAAYSHLDRIGITKRFCSIVGYDSGYGEKPGPGMVSAFIEDQNLKPHEVAMIGDSTHDLIAGNSAGAISIAVTSGGASAEALSPHADHVIADISALPELITAINMEAS